MKTTVRGSRLFRTKNIQSLSRISKGTPIHPIILHILLESVLASFFQLSNSTRLPFSRAKTQERGSQSASFRWGSSSYPTRYSNSSLRSSSFASASSTKVNFSLKSPPRRYLCREVACTSWEPSWWMMGLNLISVVCLANLSTVSLCSLLFSSSSEYWKVNLQSYSLALSSSKPQFRM